MGKKVSRPSLKKRQRELARLEKQHGKEAQRRAKSEQRKNASLRTGGEDPLRDIRPGPQPLPDEGDPAPGQERPTDSPEEDS